MASLSRCPLPWLSWVHSNIHVSNVPLAARCWRKMLLYLCSQQRGQDLIEAAARQELVVEPRSGGCWSHSSARERTRRWKTARPFACARCSHSCPEAVPSRRRWPRCDQRWEESRPGCTACSHPRTPRNSLLPGRSRQNAASAAVDPVLWSAH